MLAYAGRVEEACKLADEVMADARRCRSPSLLAWAHYVAGEVRLDSRPEEAVASYPQFSCDTIVNQYCMLVEGDSYVPVFFRSL